jgi:hypothetical protein
MLNRASLHYKKCPEARRRPVQLVSWNALTFHNMLIITAKIIVQGYKSLFYAPIVRQRRNYFAEEPCTTT